MEYSSSLKSLSQHRTSEWFMGAKLGIFIHWGLYSVPAFAPVQFGDISKTIGEHGFKFHNINNPYAEWYQNSLRLNGDIYRNYHNKNYGEDFKYEDFAPIFNDKIKNWDPSDWAKLFKKVHAKYVVLTTKHHDGFLLWNSEIKNPRKPNYESSRDIVGELSEAVRTEGLKMGLYYSGILDWTFNKQPISDVTTMLSNGNFDEEYGKYCAQHYYEIIDRFQPDILWNDIGYPPKGDLKDVIAYYFNNVPDGAVNDRWIIIPKQAKYLKNTFIIKKLINYVAKKIVKKGGLQSKPPKGFYGFSTPEYQPNAKLVSYKWESCRGIGQSFGYNRMETAEHYLSNEDLIFSFIDTVSKNGNLLLNVGPTAEGKIPKLQRERLETLGRWLDRNSEGIFGTQPWQRAEGITASNISVRFAQKNNDLFVFLLGIPESDIISIKNFKISSESKIYLMGSDNSLSFEQIGSDTKINLSGFENDWISLGIKICKKWCNS